MSIHLSLQSATFFFPPVNAYTMGVSGPYWYAAGATVQLFLMAPLAYQIRRHAPKAHTLGEVVKARWGTTVHAVVTFFMVVQNLAIAAMLLQTAGNQYEIITGVSHTEFFFLVPILAAPIVIIGGIRGVMINSYIKNIVIFLFLCVLSFGVFASGSRTALLGSPSKVYNGAVAAAQAVPANGNKAGSYLTFFSHDGLVFGALNFFANFPTLFVEQNFWQYAFATRTADINKSFFFGGALWFAIPWAIGTAAGLGALASKLVLTVPEIFTGGVLAGVTNYVFGTAGVGFLAAALWCAISSGVAGEIVALSSIITYDVMPYFVRRPTEKARQWSLWGTAAVYSVLCGVSSIILNEIGWNAGFNYLSMGPTLSAPIATIVLALTCPKCTATAALASIFGGLGLGIMTWCVTAQGLYDAVNVTTLGMNYPALAGTIVALCTPFIIAYIVSVVSPGEEYQWAEMATAGLIEDDTEEGGSVPTKKAEEEPAAVPAAPVATWDAHNLKFAAWAVGLTVLLMLVWPALTLPAGVWGKGYYWFYICLCLAWLLISTLYSTFWPLVEYWGVITGVLSAWRSGARPSVLATKSGKLEVQTAVATQ